MIFTGSLLVVVIEVRAPFPLSFRYFFQADISGMHRIEAIWREVDQVEDSITYV